ncbi:hypothetical protein HY501_02195 [Candidatus Woesearchaeota archaeon]|nr:hypothetical protein [Candidatus Woesearchaeota archaeon]
MVNRKGYIKTLEAVIAIVLILLFLFTVINKPLEKKGGAPPIVKRSQEYILNEILVNDALRGKIIAADLSNPGSVSFQDANSSVAALVEANIPPGYSYTFLMCDQTTCVTAPPSIEVDVYFDDIFISTSDATKNPRLLRLWFWPNF